MQSITTPIQAFKTKSQAMFYATFQCIILLLTCAVQASQATESASRHFDHVVWLVFENENFSEVMSEHHFNQVSSLGANFTNMLAEIHPSQGNYIAMVAGSSFNINYDFNVNLGHSHLGDLLEAKGQDWRVYAEDYPGNCFLGGSKGKYARKHVPFLSFTNVSRNADRCKKITGSSNFLADLHSGNLPAFTMMIPNLDNDGHDTGTDYAGNWLWTNLGDVLSNPPARTLFVITFDESDSGSQQNQIYTVLIGDQIKPGTQVAQTTNHIGLLKLIEDEFQLGNLGQEDKTAKAIEGLWK